jgi:hypothetical protein
MSKIDVSQINAGVNASTLIGYTPANRAGDIFSGQIASSLPTGTAPLSVNSTTMVANLSVQYLGGQPLSFVTNASNLTGTLQAAQMPALSGDVSASVGSTILTLATVNSNVGTFGSGTAIPVITVNGKGLVTAVSTTGLTLGTAATQNIGTSGANVPLLSGNNTWSGTNNFSNATVNSNVVLTTSSPIAASQLPSFSGDISTVAGSTVATLATVNANTGTFGSTTAIPVLTVNGKGLITAVSTVVLGSAAVQNIGTSGATVPLLSANNTWTGQQLFNGGPVNITWGNSTSNQGLINLYPTNYGAGNPAFFIQKTSTATEWTIGVWDGTGNNGNVNISATTFLFNNSPVMTTTASVAPSQMPALTGDVSTTAGSTTTTLATVNTNTGTWGSATQVPTFTVNGKGLVTQAANVTVTPAWTSITGTPTTIAGYGITNAQPLNSGLTSLAGLTGPGVVTATGTGSFVMNYIGAANSTDIPNLASAETVFVQLSGSTMSGPLVLSANPTIPLGAATKQYVDQSVSAAAGSNIALSGLQTIDGIALAANARVLVMGQANTTLNGVYLANSGAWARSIDLSTWSEIVGAFVFVETGAQYGATGWVCTASPSGTLGTNAVTWAQFSGAGTYTAGPGLSLVGAQFSLNLASNNTWTGTNAFGPATGVTRAGGDNSSNLATTAYVYTSTQGSVTVSVAGGTNVTLTASQYSFPIVILTGALTANISVIVPNTGSWTIHNQTTGAYTVTVTTATGTGKVCAQGQQRCVAANGINVVDEDSDMSNLTSPLNFATDNAYDIGANFANRPRNLYLAGGAIIGSGQTIVSSNRWTFGGSSADGIVSITNAEGTGFGRLQFGGTTNAFSALKSNGTTVSVRLADDSGDAGSRPARVRSAARSTSPTGIQRLGSGSLTCFRPTMERATHSFSSRKHPRPRGGTLASGTPWVITATSTSRLRRSRSTTTP